MIPMIRSADPADLNFIINSHLRSMRTHPAFKRIPNEKYFTKQKEVLRDHLIAQKTLVLCNPEDRGHIFGYVIGVPDERTFFIYIKHTYRKFGLAKRLLEALHPNLMAVTIKAAYKSKNWAAVSVKFRHIHSYE